MEQTDLAGNVRNVRVEKKSKSRRKILKNSEGLNSGAKASIYLYGARLSRVEAISVIKMRLRKIFEELALAVCGSEEPASFFGFARKRKNSRACSSKNSLPKLSLNDDFSGVTSEDFGRDEKYFRKINSPWVMYV
ncbi:hypothetical protein CDAR_433261 [Caerostris darwini]|uniref:Uncharacterized protein n=1 Tax=Caerostris darwini TaxID=1538125 RepID=A0AAV4QH44_9ARAC|nr:hypothetical protein CDAR_433261 [Caerostris darwini]